MASNEVYCDNLCAVLADLFGITARAILIKFLDEKGISDVSTLEDPEKVNLAEDIIAELFKEVCSPNRLYLKRAAVYTALDVKMLEEEMGTSSF